jgi:hypothetical protein
MSREDLSSFTSQERHVPAELTAERHEEYAADLHDRHWVQCLTGSCHVPDLLL